VILGPHLCKGNQTVMNRQLSTSISRKHLPENLVGEGWGEGCPEKKRPPLNPSPGRHRFAMLSSGSRPLPQGERWTEHVAPLSLSNAFGSCIRHF
jgi:hypothetical protein